MRPRGKLGLVLLAGMLVACPPTRGGGSTVGSVEQVLNAQAFVNGSTAGPGNGFRAAATLSTDGTGVMTFHLNVKIDHCKLFQSSNVQASPTSDTLLHVGGGRTWCSTNPDSTLEIRLTTTNALLRVSDPIFGVGVEKDGTLVRVARGFVRVQSLDTGGEVTVLVGPLEQTFVPAGQDPQPPEAFALSALDGQEQKTVEEFIAGLPSPDFGPPSSTESSTIQRIFARGSISVALDEAALKDQGTTNFVSEFLGFLSASWNLRLNAFTLPVEEAGAALDGGKADLFISPATVSGAATIPFFQDPPGQDWFLDLSPDTGFQDALTAFLQAALQAGEYGSRYQDAFQQPPPYEFLGSLITPAQ